jgi:hypothetical protein
MNIYLNATLPSLDETSIILPAQLANIQAIHATCSLASARRFVRASLSSSTPPSGSTDTSVLTISLDGVTQPKADDELTLSFLSPPTWPSIGRIPLSRKQKMSQWADIIRDSVNNAPQLKGVSASIVQYTDTSVTINLASQTGDQVKWSYTLKDQTHSKINVSIAAPGKPSASTAAPAGPAAPVTAAKTN